MASRVSLDSQARLILRENGKIILPYEHFANAVMLKHMNGPHGLHLGVEGTVRAVKKYFYSLIILCCTMFYVGFDLNPTFFQYYFISYFFFINIVISFLYCLKYYYSIIIILSCRSIMYAYKVIVPSCL